MAAGFKSPGVEAADSCSAWRHILLGLIRACEKSQRWQQALDLQSWTRVSTEI